MSQSYKKNQTILNVTHLRVGHRDKKKVNILRDISFSIFKTETFGIIGETGSGKTMTANSVMNLLPESIYKKKGEVFLEGIPIHTFSMNEMRKILGLKIAFIPQNSSTALNPLYKIGFQFEFVLRNRFKINTLKARSRAKEWFEKVKLRNIDRIYNSYPCQLSGGQNQRISIALALSLDPSLLIADEPTTALDSITQQEILSLLLSLKKEYELSIMFITHDISIVKKICDRVAVMFKGQIVECGITNQILTNPKHSYSKSLLNSLPTSRV